MSNKSSSKKKIDKTRRYKETSGGDVVSPDGRHVKIGGSTFKRTVLPSVAAQHVESEKLASDLEELEVKIYSDSEDSV